MAAALVWVSFRRLIIPRISRTSLALRSSSSGLPKPRSAKTLPLLAVTFLGLLISSLHFRSSRGNEHNDDIISAYTMGFAMQVLKWGDCLAVRLPKAPVEKMGLRAGDELNIVDVVERTLVVQKQDRRKAALERLASRNWTLPPITHSIGMRPTSGEGVFRYQHSLTLKPARQLFPGCCAAHSGPRIARPEHRLSGALLNPGSTLPAHIWVPALRSSVKSAAPRPGHEPNLLSPLW